VFARAEAGQAVRFTAAQKSATIVYWKQFTPLDGAVRHDPERRRIDRSQGPA